MDSYWLVGNMKNYLQPKISIIEKCSKFRNYLQDDSETINELITKLQKLSILIM